LALFQGGCSWLEHLLLLGTGAWHERGTKKRMSQILWLLTPTGREQSISTLKLAGYISQSIDHTRIHFVRRGKASVVKKQKYPWWVPTARMRFIDPTLPERVPPGPANPLGTYSLYLSWPEIRIHGNNDPSTVGEVSTSGCFRMYESDIAFLFDLVKVRTPVQVS
jgi:hypothetical protein